MPFRNIRGQLGNNVAADGFVNSNYIGHAFSPMDLTPSFYVAPGNYSNATGLWTSTIGPNLINFNGISVPLPAPPEVNGCPDMIGESQFHELIDEAPGVSGNAQDATPFNVWSSPTERTWAVLAIPKNIDAYGIDPTAYYNNAVLFSDFNVYVGIMIRVDTTGVTPRFFAHYQDYSADASQPDLDYTASIEITQYVDSNGVGSLFIQGRKQPNGLMQIKCNDSEWIDGDIGVPTADDTAQGPCIGQGLYKGLIKAAISYQRALSNLESDSLWGWAKQYI